MLLELAKFMETRPEIHMKHFARDDYGHMTNDPHDCKTPGCVLGWASIIFEHNSENYWDLAEDLFNISDRTTDWHFLFGINWPDDPLEAAGRIRYYLEHGTGPYNQSYKEHAHE